MFNIFFDLLCDKLAERVILYSSGLAVAWGALQCIRVLAPWMFVPLF
jgi:hypothetical protein